MSPSSLPSSQRWFRIRALPLLASCLGWAVIAGCAHRVPKPTPYPKAASPLASPSLAAPVIHYSRYTLIEMAPEAAQSDLLQQVVDVRIPAAANTSVGDTLRYVLLHSGYRLCEDPAIRDFDGFPLPAAHMHLGPVPLASALQLLVGRDWQLETDEGSRRVCFSRGAGSPAHATTHLERHPHTTPSLPSAPVSTGERE
jgi:conjugative transfer region protein (TIGR03748 family)